MAQTFSTTILYLLLQSIAFQKSAIAEDTLVRNQKIGVKQILVSQNQVFEMGFFSPGKSINRFLGIWYKSTPEVVVWVANRNNPLTAPQAPVLMISGNGSLVISSGKSVIWSASSSSGAVSNPVLQLLDSGNLVLVDNTSTMEGYIWQSFDYPTDTILPGMKLIDKVESSVQRSLTSWRNADDPSPGDFSVRIENQGLPEMVIFKGEKKRYRNGKWNGIHFSGVPRPQIPSSLFHPNVVFREEMIISMIEPYENSILIRVTIVSNSCHYLIIMQRKQDKNKDLDS